MAKSHSRVLDMINTRFPTYHPLMALAEIAHDSNTRPHLRIDCHKTIAEYVEPKLKSVDIRGHIEVPKVVVSLFDGEYVQIEDKRDAEGRLNALANESVDKLLESSVAEAVDWADVMDEEL